MHRLLERLLVFPLQAFLIGLAVLVAYKFLNGTIRMAGLIRDPITGQSSALRVQQLLATLVLAASYSAKLMAVPPGGAMPPVSAELMALIGTSNAIVVLHGAFRYLVSLLRPSTPSEQVIQNAHRIHSTGSRRHHLHRHT